MEDKIIRMNKTDNDEMSLSELVKESTIGFNTINDSTLTDLINTLPNLDDTKGFIKIPEGLQSSFKTLNDRTEEMRQSLIPFTTSLTGLSSILDEYNNIWDKYGIVFAKPLPMVEAAQAFNQYQGFLSIGSGISMTKIAERELADDIKTHYPDAVIFKKDDYSLQLQPTSNNEMIELSEVRQQMGIAQFLPDIGMSELQNFENHLKQFPMMALEDKAGTGRKILEAIQKMVTKTETHIQTIAYRARKMKRTDAQKDIPSTDLPDTLLKLEDMYGPPTVISGQGRFNLTGHSAMYTCSDELATLQEIRAVIGDFDTIYRFNIDRKFTVLDMTDDNHRLFAHCMLKVENDSSANKIHEEYLLPNFIAECCRFADIDVIRYRSVQHPKSINHVFFGFPNHHLKGTEAGRFRVEESGAIFQWD